MCPIGNHPAYDGGDDGGDGDDDGGDDRGHDGGDDRDHDDGVHDLDEHAQIWPLQYTCSFCDVFWQSYMNVLFSPSKCLFLSYDIFIFCLHPLQEHDLQTDIFSNSVI